MKTSKIGVLTAIIAVGGMLALSGCGTTQSTNESSTNTTTSSQSPTGMQATGGQFIETSQEQHVITNIETYDNQFDFTQAVFWIKDDMPPVPTNNLAYLFAQDNLALTEMKIELQNPLYNIPTVVSYEKDMQSPLGVLYGFLLSPELVREKIVIDKNSISPSITSAINMGNISIASITKYPSLYSLFNVPVTVYSIPYSTSNGSYIAYIVHNPTPFLVNRNGNYQMDNNGSYQLEKNVLNGKPNSPQYTIAQLVTSIS